MDKEDVVPMYNGILLGCEKDQNQLICRDLDELSVCHTE